MPEREIAVPAVEEAIGSSDTIPELGDSPQDTSPSTNQEDFSGTQLTPGLMLPR